MCVCINAYKKLVACEKFLLPHHICSTCALVCKTSDGLTRYSKIHQVVFQPGALKVGHITSANDHAILWLS